MVKYLKLTLREFYEYTQGLYTSAVYWGNYEFRPENIFIPVLDNGELYRIGKLDAYQVETAENQCVFYSDLGFLYYKDSDSKNYDPFNIEDQGDGIGNRIHLIGVTKLNFEKFISRLFNQPPSKPTSIDYENPTAGLSIKIIIGKATDPDNDTIQYVYERKIDAGAYKQIAITPNLSFTDVVPEQGTSYTVRVKAVDSQGNESEYFTGLTKTISHNTPPSISGSDGHLGVFVDPLQYEYSVSDKEGGSLTIVETVTSGKTVWYKKTKTAQSGDKLVLDLTDVWHILPEDTQAISLLIKDDKGETFERRLTFQRSVPRLACYRSIQTTKIVKEVQLSLFVLPNVNVSSFHCEVTNNPFDPNPVWEDMGDKLNKGKHVFENRDSEKFGLAYRFRANKGSHAKIKQVTVTYMVHGAESMSEVYTKAIPMDELEKMLV